MISKQTQLLITSRTTKLSLKNLPCRHAKVRNVRNNGDWERPERERGTAWKNAGDWERPEQEKGMAWLREIGTVRERGTVWLLGRVKMWRRYIAEIVFSNLGFHIKKITEIVFATVEFHLGFFFFFFFFFFTAWNSSLCFFFKKKNSLYQIYVG